MTDSVLGVVLAGGRSSRFGGVDKGLQQIKGETLTAHVLNSMADLPAKVISANRHLEQYRAFGYPVVSDQRADFQGPLSGIESVMREHVADWYAVCPADVLGMPNAWWQRLFEQARVRQVPWVGTSDGGRLQPLLGLWSRALLPTLSVYLDSGERRVMPFVTPWADAALALPEGCPLHNLNTPEAIAMLESSE